MLVCLHTTESDPGTLSGVVSYLYRIGVMPHTCYDPSTGEEHIFLPPTENATALLHPPGTPETNNRAGGVFQIEIVGRSADCGSYDDAWYSRLRTYLVDWSTALGVPYVFYVGPRMTDAQWADPSLQGLVGHCHVPNNDHWDPGTLDYNRLDIQPEENDMTPDQLAHALGGELNLMGQVCVPLISDDLKSSDLYTVAQALSFIHQELKVARLAPPVTAVSAVSAAAIADEFASRLTR